MKGRTPEAAFLARTYKPSQASELVGLWRENLAKVSKRAAESLADPAQYPNLFPNLEVAMQAMSVELRTGRTSLKGTG